MEAGHTDKSTGALRSRRLAAQADATLASSRPTTASLDLIPARLTEAVATHVLPGLVGRNADAASRARIAEEQRASDAADPAVAEMLDLLRDDSSDAYESFAFERLSESHDPQFIARTLLEPVARSIGAAWCGDTEDFVEVTFVVSRLQRLFWKLASECPAERRSEPQKLALLAPTPGEQHTFGLSIIEDQLRRAGWEVDCCRSGDGAEMLHLASANKYRFVGISLSGEALLPSFSSAIAKLKAKSKNRSIMVIAGGSLSTRRPDMAVAAGADCVGENGRSILRLAEVALAADRPNVRDHFSVE